MISYKVTCCPVSYIYLIKKSLFVKFDLICDPSADFIVMTVVCSIVKSLVKSSCKSYKQVSIFL